MTFHEAIAAIPFAPSRQEATGIWAPIVRAMGHIMYVVAELSEETSTLTGEEAHRELRDATNHLSGVITRVNSAPLSTGAKNLYYQFISAVDLAYVEWTDWEPDDRVRNLKDLADRCAALAAFTDAELAGVRDADPGRSL